MIDEGTEAADILKFIEEVNHLKDVDTVLDRVLYRSRQVTRADAGSIFLLDGDRLRFAYVHNDTLFKKNTTDKSVYADFTIPVDETSFVGFVAKTGETLVIDDAYNLPADVPYSFNASYDERVGYHTTSLLTIPLKSMQDRLIGVMQIINAKDETGESVPFSEESQKYLPILVNNAAIAIERGLMTRELILRMMKMAELRDPTETGAHVQRVGAYSAELYKQWAHNRLEGSRLNDHGQELTNKEIRHTTDLIRLSAMLHDVGKVGIPDAILKKPGRLDEDEFRNMQRHTVLGARLFINATSELDRMCYDIALNHHEKWAGKGYPGRVEQIMTEPPAMGTPKEGQEIPLVARIVALADVYDALCSKRCYKEAWPEEKTLSIIEEEKGRHFDPEVVVAFFQIHEVMLAIRDKFQDAPAGY